MVEPPLSTIKIRRRLLRACSWPFLFVVLFTPSYAQGPEDPYRMLETVKQLEVEFVAGSVPLYFSPGYEERAIQLQGMLVEATSFFRESLAAAVTYNLAVLDEPQWKALHPREGGPYGVPYTSLGKPWLIVLPAVPEHSIIARGLSKSHDGVVAQRMVDLIGFHELGHVYTSECLYPDDFVNPYPTIRWFDEMLGTYFAYAFLRHTHPEWVDVWDAVIDAYLAFPDQQYTSLDDFDEKYYQISNVPLGDGPSNYGWYQATFHNRVRAVFDAQGLTFLRRLQEELPWENFEEWTSEELLTWLEAIEPGFQAWARDLEK